MSLSTKGKAGLDHIKRICGKEFLNITLFHTLLPYLYDVHKVSNFVEFLRVMWMDLQQANLNIPKMKADDLRTLHQQLVEMVSKRIDHKLFLRSLLPADMVVDIPDDLVKNVDAMVDWYVNLDFSQYEADEVYPRLLAVTLIRDAYLEKLFVNIPEEPGLVYSAAGGGEAMTDRAWFKQNLVGDFAHVMS